MLKKILLLPIKFFKEVYINQSIIFWSAMAFAYFIKMMITVINGFHMNGIEIPFSNEIINFLSNEGWTRSDGSFIPALYYLDLGRINTTHFWEMLVVTYSLSTFGSVAVIFKRFTGYITKSIKDWFTSGLLSRTLENRVIDIIVKYMISDIILERWYSTPDLAKSKVKVKVLEELSKDKWIYKKADKIIKLLFENNIIQYNNWSDIIDHLWVKAANIANINASQYKIDKRVEL